MIGMVLLDTLMARIQAISSYVSLCRKTLGRLTQNRGVINTPMVAGVDPGHLDNLLNRVPLSRIGQPEEAASVWAFLLSDEAKYSRSRAALMNGKAGCLWEKETLGWTGINLANDSWLQLLLQEDTY